MVRGVDRWVVSLSAVVDSAGECELDRDSDFDRLRMELGGFAV